MLQAFLFNWFNGFFITLIQIFPPEEEKEEVKVVQVSDEDKMKEHERAAKRLLNACLVHILFPIIFPSLRRWCFVFYGGTISDMCVQSVSISIRVFMKGNLFA